jgi:hypothetical protein
MQGNKIFKRIFEDKIRAMRVTITVSLLFILLLQAAGQQHIHKVNAPFDHVKVSGNIHLRLVASETTFLEFETEDFPESLTIEQDKSKLWLKSKTDLKQGPATVVKMHHTGLAGLEITRGAIVQSADTLHSDMLSLRVETGGKAEFSVATDSLSARVNQGSDIILSGSTRSLQVNASTMGNFLAYELQTVNAWVKARSGGQVKVNATQLLDANSSGGAFIGYKGEPAEKEFKTSVGGKISPQTE